MRLREYAIPDFTVVQQSIMRPAINANNFELKPGLIHMVQQVQFGGGPLDDPHAHLANFLEICDTVKINGASEDAIRLRWSKNHYMKHGKDLRIYKGSAHIMAFRNGLLYKHFYKCLIFSVKITIDAAAGGALMNKEPKEAYALLEEMASNNYQWSNYKGMQRKELREGAKFEVDKAMLTDAPLLFPPGQLALAALRRSNEILNAINFERYLERIFSRQPPAHNSSQLIESFNAIDFLVGKLAIPTAKDMRHIDRKLRSCLDPSSQDESKKREKKSKHKSKRTLNEMQGAVVEG